MTARHTNPFSATYSTPFLPIPRTRPPVHVSVRTRRCETTATAWRDRLTFCLLVDTSNGTLLAAVEATSCIAVQRTVCGDHDAGCRRLKKGNLIRKDGTQSLWPKSRQGTGRQGCQASLPCDTQLRFAVQEVAGLRTWKQACAELFIGVHTKRGPANGALLVHRPYVRRLQFRLLSINQRGTCT